MDSDDMKLDKIGMNDYTAEERHVYSRFTYTSCEMAFESSEHIHHPPKKPKPEPKPVVKVEKVKADDTPKHLMSVL